MRPSQPLDLLALLRVAIGYAGRGSLMRCALPLVSHGVRLFVGRDPILMHQGQRDFIHAFEQAFFCKRLDLEMRLPAELI